MRMHPFVPLDERIYKIEKKFTRCFSIARVDSKVQQESKVDLQKYETKLLNKIRMQYQDNRTCISKMLHFKDR